jgi:hypothetical protein
MDIPIIPRHLRIFEGENPVKGSDLRKAITQIWSELARVVNGRIDFGSPQGQAIKATGNIDGVWPGTLVNGYMITTPGVANTEFTVTHNLGRVPVGYDVKSKDKAANIYDSRKTQWTATQMFLKADVATVQIVLFVH